MMPGLLTVVPLGMPPWAPYYMSEPVKNTFLPVQARGNSVKNENFINHSNSHPSLSLSDSPSILGVGK